jgi:hypothetical protein
MIDYSNYKEKFKNLEEQALEIMSRVYDPFHDEKHVLETWNTAQELAGSIHEEHGNINLDILKMACLWHDTSRESIKTYIVLQPILDGIMSAKKIKQYFRLHNMPPSITQDVVDMVKSNEEIYGVFKKEKSASQLVFSEADKLEMLSTERVDRGMRRFENGDFSRKLFNFYFGSLIFLFRNGKFMDFRIAKSRLLADKRATEMVDYFSNNNTKTRMERLMYKPLFKFFYNMMDRDPQVKFRKHEG